MPLTTKVPLEVGTKVVSFVMEEFHKRLPAPVAERVMLSPGHATRSGPASIFGAGLIVSNIESEAKQPFGLVAKAVT
jgi:hypothetical protein